MDLIYVAKKIEMRCASCQFQEFMRDSSDQAPGPLHARHAVPRGATLAADTAQPGTWHRETVHAIGSTILIVRGHRVVGQLGARL